MKKKGNILICGMANAGKSTLINQIAKYDLSLVNKKPQTTRKNAKFLFEDNKSEILFVDTPGFHFAKTKLDESMNKEISKNYREANCVWFLYDLNQKLNEEAIFFMKELNKKVSDKLILVLTKSDLVENNKLDNLMSSQLEAIQTYLKFSKYINISHNNPDDYQKIINLSYDFLNENNFIFFQNVEDDNFLISEIIREITLNNLRQEIPYGIHIHIEEKKYNLEKNMFYIEAYVICEKESQKKIIVGNKGSMIKKIGTLSRIKLLKKFDTKIFLDLKVKVWNDWRNNERIIKKII